MEPSRKTILVAVFITAFLDLVGFSIIFPLFPQLLDYYVTLEGQQSLIGQFVGMLRSLTGNVENAQFLVEVLFGGLLGSLYSVLQFAFAPIWGVVSDRRGRRWTLVLTLTGTVLSYVLWFFAGSFGLLIAARFIGGIMAGNVSTASAVVADVTEADERSRGMAVIGIAVGLGFIVGPAIGGLASFVDLTKVAPDLARFGVNPFSAAAAIAFLLSVLNLVLVVTRLPETHPLEKRGQAGATRSANPLVLFRGVGVPGVQATNLVSFFYLTAFSAMEFTLVFLAVERFGFTPRKNAMMFVFVGLTIAAVQGGIVRRLAPKIGDKKVAVAGLVLLLPGFLIVGFSASVFVLFVGLGFMATGSALATPCLSALVSRYAPAAQQGLALGLFRSMGALSRAVGPILGGVLYWKLGAHSPYVVGAALLLIPVALSSRLPTPP